MKLFAPLYLLLIFCSCRTAGTSVVTGKPVNLYSFAIVFRGEEGVENKVINSCIKAGALRTPEVTEIGMGSDVRQVQMQLRTRDKLKPDQVKEELEQIENVIEVKIQKTN